MTRAAIDSGDKREGSTAPWAKVKFDRQIVAIARTEGATVVYADDDGIRRFGKRLGMEVIGLIETSPPTDQPTARPALRKAEEKVDAQLLMRPDTRRSGCAISTRRCGSVHHRRGNRSRERAQSEARRTAAIGHRRHAEAARRTIERTEGHHIEPQGQPLQISTGSRGREKRSLGAGLRNYAIPTSVRYCIYELRCTSGLTAIVAGPNRERNQLMKTVPGKDARRPRPRRPRPLPDEGRIRRLIMPPISEGARRADANISAGRTSIVAQSSNHALGGGGDGAGGLAGAAQRQLLHGEQERQRAQKADHGRHEHPAEADDEARRGLDLGHARAAVQGQAFGTTEPRTMAPKAATTIGAPQRAEEVHRWPWPCRAGAAPRRSARRRSSPAAPCRDRGRRRPSSQLDHEQRQVRGPDGEGRQGRDRRRPARPSARRL